MENDMHATKKSNTLSTSGAVAGAGAETGHLLPLSFAAVWYSEPVKEAETALINLQREIIHTQAMLRFHMPASPDSLPGATASFLQEIDSAMKQGQAIQVGLLMNLYKETHNYTKLVAEEQKVSLGVQINECKESASRLCLARQTRSTHLPLESSTAWRVWHIIDGSVVASNAAKAARDAALSMG